MPTRNKLFQVNSAYYCRFRNVRENLIFANIHEFVASQSQSSRKYWLVQKKVTLIFEDL